MQQKEKKAGERGRREGKEGEEGRRKEVRSRKTASEGEEGGDLEEKRRRRVHQLEKEKLELSSKHNQEVRNWNVLHVFLSDGGFSHRMLAGVLITLFRFLSTYNYWIFRHLEVNVFWTP